MSGIGIQIRVERRRAGLTQQWLANRCGISNVYLCYIEREQREPSLALVRKIAKVLNCYVSYRLVPK